MPSGASTGIYEALELRDGDKSRYLGKGEGRRPRRSLRVRVGSGPGYAASSWGVEDWNPILSRNQGPQEEA